MIASLYSIIIELFFTFIEYFFQKPLTRPMGMIHLAHKQSKHTFEGGARDEEDQSTG